MAYSYVRYTGNGSTQNYTFSFPYINQDHIKVRVNGVITTAWSFLNSSTVQFTSAPASGAILEIRRETPKDSAIVNFTDGSVLLERDLDLLATYDLYLAQETKDGLDASITQTSLGVWDGQSKRLTNVADPVSAQDVATKNWSETSGQSFVGASSASAASALSSATSATASATSATASAASAAASATSATASASNAAISEANSLLAVTYYGATAPSPILYKRWISSDDLREYIYLNDGDSSQWVEVAGPTTHAVQSAQSSDVSFQQSGTGAVERMAQDKMRETVSVKDFGAVGDGVTDDTAAIQNAINAANGAEILIPAGRYKITSTITSFNTSGQTSNGVRVVGEGPDKTIIVNHVASGSGFYFDHRVGSTNYGNQVYSKGSYIKNLCITGSSDGIPTRSPGAQKTRLGNHGLRIKGLWSAAVENVVISDHTGYGVWVDVDTAYNPDITASVRLRVIGCWLAWNKIGFYAPEAQAVPTCTVQSTAVDFNDEIGILHCSAYFKIFEGSISFNGFYTYSGDHTPNANYGGLVIANSFSSTAFGCEVSQVELDGNMPQQIFVMACDNFRIKSCKIKVRLQGAEVNKFVLVFGATTPAGVFKCANPLVQDNAILLDAGSYVGKTLKVFRFNEGCSYGKVGKNTYYNSASGLVEGTNFIYIEELVRTGQDAAAQRSLEWEFQSGYLSMPGYLVQYINGFFADIPNNTVVTFRPPMNYGILALQGGSSFTHGIIGFIGTSGTTFAMATLSTGVNILTNTVLTGTTGTVGRLTVSVSNGVVYVENRLGATTPISVRILTDLQYGKR